MMIDQTHPRFLGVLLTTLAIGIWGRVVVFFMGLLRESD